MIFVINKEKVYAYVVSILTIVILFFMSHVMSSDTSTEDVSGRIEQANNVTTNTQQNELINNETMTEKKENNSTINEESTDMKQNNTLDSSVETGIVPN